MNHSFIPCEIFLVLRWFFAQCNYEDDSLLANRLFVSRSSLTMPLLCSDAYLERLRKDIAMVEVENRKVSGEISVTAGTTFNGWFLYFSCFLSCGTTVCWLVMNSLCYSDMVQFDGVIEVLESLFSKLGPEVSI